MDRDLAEIAVSKARELGAEYAEARMEFVSGQDSLLKNGNPEVSGFERDAGIGIRVKVNGALAFASTNRLDRDSVLAACERSVRTARASSRIMKNPLEFAEGKANIKDYSVFQKKNISNIGPEDVLRALSEIEKALPSENLVGSYFSLGIEHREKYFCNSEGSKIASSIPRLHLFMLGTILEDGRTAQAMLQLGAASGWEFMDIDKLSHFLGNEIKMTHKNMKEGIKAPKELVDMVLGPEVTGIAAHESCGHPYEGDRILGREAAQAGESFVSEDMMGQQIGSEVATVIDDPTLENSYGFYLYDDEGIEARPRELIKDGKINDFLHNRESAARMGVESNGSSRSKNYDREAIVRMANTYVKPGEYSLEELVEDVKLGVLMNSFMEWNIDDKRYNQRYIGREAYLIENGRIGAPVKAPILEMTTPAFWSAIDAVGKEVGFTAATCGKGEPGQGIAVFTGGPHIRLRNIKLGGE